MQYIRVGHTTSDGADPLTLSLVLIGDGSRGTRYSNYKQTVLQGQYKRTSRSGKGYSHVYQLIY